MKPWPSFAVLDRSENLQIIEKLENILFYHFTTGTEFTLHIHLNCLPSAFEVRTLWIDVIAKNKSKPPSTGTKIRRFVLENSIYPRGSAAQWYPIQFSSTALSYTIPCRQIFFIFPFFQAKQKGGLKYLKQGVAIRWEVPKKSVWTILIKIGKFMLQN